MVTWCGSRYAGLAPLREDRPTPGAAHRAVRPPAPRRPHPRPRDRRAAGAVRLRSQRRPLPARGRAGQPDSPMASVVARSAGSRTGRRTSTRTCARCSPRSRATGRRYRAIPQAAYRRRGPRRRRRDHHGLRRRLPDHPRRPLRGLAGRRPGARLCRGHSKPSATTSPPASAPCSTPFNHPLTKARPDHDRPQALRPVRLRAQRRPLPDGRRIPPRTSPATASRSARPAPMPADQINPVAVEAMRRSGHRHRRASSPRCSPPRPSRPPTWSSRWAAATPAPTTRASATRTGSSTTPPARASSAVRPIRDEIRTRVEGLIRELLD